MEEGVSAPSLIRTNMAVAFGSLGPVASQNAMEGGDIQKPWMNKRKTETMGVGGSLVTFWPLRKLPSRWKPWTEKNRHSLMPTRLLQTKY
jgi:hypothetical protein